MKPKNKKVFILFFLFSLSFFYKTKASDYYWVGGTGNWSDYANHWATTSGGLIFHIQIPSAFDNVIFDANSFSATGQTVTVDSTLIYCNNMTWTGVINNPSITGSYINLKIYGSLTLSNAMNWDLFNGSINFEATSAGKTVTTAGQSFNGASLNFKGVGGNWILMDSFAGAGSINLTNGTLNTNNQAVSCGSLSSSGTGNLDLGTSVITCSTWSTSISGTALDADSAIINCSGIFTGGNSNVYKDITCDVCGFGNSNTVHDAVCSSQLNCTGNNTFHDVLFSGAWGYISGNNIIHKATFVNNTVNINGNNTFDTLFFDNPGNVVSFYAGTTQTINNTLLANSNCSALINFQSNQPGSYGTIHKASGTVAVDYIMIKDVHTTGSANFIANNSVNLGNTTGWTINSPAAQNLYWVGGTGNWDDVNHWATTSGGAGGNCIPTPFDNVFFDANSFTATGQTLTVNVSTIFCNNMTWTGVINNPSITGSYINLKIYGSLTLSNAMNWDLFNGSINFEATSAGKTVTTAGQSFNGASLNFKGVGGNWILMDSFAGAGSINLTNGTLNTNNQAVSCGSLSSSGTGNLDLGTSVITCSTWSTSISGTALDADSAIINCSGIFTGGNSNVYKDITCDVCGFGNSNTVHDAVCSSQLNCTGNNTFHDVLFSGAWGYISGNNIIHKATFVNNTVNINGNNTFDTLFFDNPGNVVSFYAGTTQTINNTLLANSNCSALINFQSNQPGSYGTIHKASGTVAVDYIMIKDVHTTGSANFIANNSVNLGNTTGWTINSPAAQNLYWVGGTGNWDDVNHWATTSGGAGGNCIPTPFDNVFFDANSFTATGQTLTVNVSTIFCNNMTWTGVINNPSITGSYINLKIYGSLTLSNAMNWDLFNGSINFEATSAGKTVTTAGQSFNGASLNFKGVGGNWILMDSFAGAGSINLTNGTLNTNNQAVSCGSLSSSGTGNLDLGTSVITCSTWSTSISGTALDADSAIINCSGIFTGGNSNVYKDITCDVCGFGNSNTVHDAVCSSQLNCTGNNTFHDVLFSGAWGYISGNNIIHKATFVNNTVNINGNNTFDTLFFDNPGNVVSFYAGTTQTINNTLLANPLPGFPISFQSNQSGNTATVNKSSGSVCLNYLIMKDIHATGGATFCAGDYSTDLGNNTGWSFTSCAPAISNVWPGDANYDLVCNNLDILNIGVAYNDTGYIRAGASLTWVAQPGLDWLSQFLSGTNAKHADCDGNGVVDALDTLAVSLNYGLTHPFRLSSGENTASTGTDLYFDMPMGSLVPGSAVSIPINFGTTGNPANNVYGIAFTVNYDPAFIQAGSMYFDYTGSWAMTPSNNYIHIEKDFSVSGGFDAGMCRINHQNVSGNGLIATLHFTVANNASGLLTLSFSNVLAISNNEIPIPVNPQGGSVPTGIDELADNGGFNLYPNPVKDYLYFGENNNSVSRIIIYDCFGQEVADVLSDRKKIFLGNLPQGMYLIYAFDKDMQKVFVKKFIKD